MKYTSFAGNIWLITCVLAFALFGSSCTDKPRYSTFDGEALGTTFHIGAQLTEQQRSRVYAMVDSIDREAKASMSIFDPESRLSRINSGLTDSLDSHIIYNITLADSLSRLSDGAYDITIKPIVDVLGFAAKSKRKVEDRHIDSLLQFVGYQKIRIENSRLIKSDERVQIDLNSIAKGYTVDLIAQELERMGAKNYIVEVGGELRCRGVNQNGDRWRVGIDSPFDGNYNPGEELQVVLPLSDCAVATSGNYRRFFIDEDGNKIAHTLDPKTGKSVISRLLSATVIAPNCTKADALCTMFMALGDKRAIELAQKIDSIMVYFILAGEDGKEYEIFCSEQLHQQLLKK